jgi:hypothetical protein
MSQANRGKSIIEKSLLDWALSGLSRGFYVFPCKPRSKQPNGELVPHGVNDATNSESQIREWWQREPEGNPAVALGPSNITVLDVDSGLTDISAAREWCHRNQLPSTLTVRTGRRDSFGLQLYFSGIVANRPYDHDGASGEVRSTGYYVMLPGSVHDKTGERYQIIADRPLAAVPDLVNRLARFVLPRPQGNSSEKVTPSCRHYYFVERGRELHFAGLSGEGLHTALRWLYENRCVRDPQKDERVSRGELREVSRWIEDHPPEYPLQPKDFVALRHAEKDPLVQHAWAGDVLPFDGDREKALNHLIRRLNTMGCREEQIIRIVKASPLMAAMEKEPLFAPMEEKSPNGQDDTLEKT